MPSLKSCGVHQHEDLGGVISQLHCNCRATTNRGSRHELEDIPQLERCSFAPEVRQFCGFRRSWVFSDSQSLHHVDDRKKHKKRSRTDSECHLHRLFQKAADPLRIQLHHHHLGLDFPNRVLHQLLEQNRTGKDGGENE